MLCPICSLELKISERQGVEIDYCPRCRGVWLDRGELDKIIDRSKNRNAPQPQRQYRKPQKKYRYENDYEDYHYDDRGHRDHKGGKYYKKRKRKSVLDEIFDIFD